MNGLLIIFFFVFMYVAGFGTSAYITDKNFLKEIENDDMVGQAQKDEYKNKIIPKDLAIMILGWVFFAICCGLMLWSAITE